MKEIKRKARVQWAGDLRNGRGEISTESQAIDSKIYSVPSRFEEGPGTNPEELIAAAHAACFSMMLAKVIGDQKNSIEEISTNATVIMQFDNGKAKITEIQLRTEARVTGMSQDAFKKAAEEAKETCPVSNLLKPGLQKISVEAVLL